MRKLVTLALAITIFAGAGCSDNKPQSKSDTLSTRPTASQDFEPKHIQPRPEPTRASRTRRMVTHSEHILTDSSVWDRLAMCESGGNWHINTGNGFYGGIQFDLSSWHSAGGIGYPHQATRAEQIKRGKIWKSMRHGWNPWPACSRKLGLR